MLSNHSPNVAVIEAAYAAFNRRDIDAVLALMRSDVDWPNGMDGTRVHGHQAVRAYWTYQWGVIDPHVEPTNIHDGADGNTVVDVHQVVRDLSGNTLFDATIRHIYRIEDGLIVRMDIESSVLLTEMEPAAH